LGQSSKYRNSIRWLTDQAYIPRPIDSTGG